MRLIFMGTPDFSVPVLERLLDDGHEVAAVFTQPDKPSGRGNKLQAPPVKLAAMKKQITVYQPARIKNNDEVREAFVRIAPDACVVSAYGKILPEWLLSIPRLGCINVHSSLLPKYRGAAPINWAIVNGEARTGVTIMQMDPGMDTGPMLAARAIDIAPEETAVELSVRLSALGAALLSETLPQIELGQIQPVHQDNSQASYAPMLKREDGLIDWSMPAKRISDRVRGFQPWPGSYTVFRGARLILWHAYPVVIASSAASASSQKTPGTISGFDKSAIVVSCASDSLLRIDELQIEGKRRVTARDFANGARLAPGSSITDESSRS